MSEQDNTKEPTKIYNVEEADWQLDGEGQGGDPNLNVCESCQ